ncbi:MAG: Ig-like domain-containing protein [Verrucomicrobiota bacterium]|jgi:plastocyanin
MRLNSKIVRALLLAGGCLAHGNISTASAAIANVSVINFAFVPATTNINVGDTVVWTWQPNANNHNVTSTSATPAWTASETMDYPAAFTNTFSIAGSFPYKCSIHLFTGSITVDSGSGSVSGSSVAISSPSTGEIYTSPATVNLTTTISGDVANVEFFTNGGSAGSVTSAPFSLTLTNLQPGPYAVTAMGTADGTATNSAEVDFLVVTNYSSVPGTPPGRNFNKPGNILIADQFNNRVVEITPNGQIVWSFGLGPDDFSANSIIGVNDAERIGTWTLMAGTGTPSGIDPSATNGASDNRVLLVDSFDRPIWQYGQFGQAGFGANQLNGPVQCTYLPTSHILITDQGNDRVIEVTLDKNIVWSYPGNNTNAPDQLNSPNSAELLTNGNILIADEGHNRAIEVTRDDVIARTFTAGGTASGIEFASRLPNGHTLLADAANSRAVEVDANDKIVWEYFTTNSPGSISAPTPSRALRLRNGDTLISDQFNNRVIRVNHARHIVASYGLRLDGGGVIGNNTGYNTNSVDKGMFAPYDAKVINDFTGLTPPVDNTADSLNEADPPPSSSGSEW